MASSTRAGSALQRRRRFLIVSVAALAVLAAGLGVSFAGPSGTANLSVTSSSTNFVFPVDDGISGLPANVLTLKYTPTAGISGSAFTSSVVNPTWSPAANSAGSVTTAGDLVLLDARSATLGDHTTLLVSMYVTNLAGLQQAYSSFAFPVNIYKCTPTTATDCDTGAEWVQASNVIASAPTFLTNTEGFLTFSLPAGPAYVIAFDTGGSFYTVSTSTAANLEPTFYFTATPT